MSSNNYFLSWAEAALAGAGQAGGKGFNLGRLAVYGFRVPAGGVLNTEAYRDFIVENGLADEISGLAADIQARGFECCADRLAALRSQIQAGRIPDPVVASVARYLQASGLEGQALAVRSSASAEDGKELSFAGIHESCLNVTGIENVLQAVKDCYASLWLEKAAAYRQCFSLAQNEVVPAVVVMAMVPARAAGVAFTCEPQTGRRDRMVIHGNHGLGESVVNGSAEPDSYYLDTSAFSAYPRLVERHTGSKLLEIRPDPAGGTRLIERPAGRDTQVLSDDQAEALGSEIIRIFDAMGQGEEHQDVEWAFDGQDFFILQARPVTALPHFTFDPLKHLPATWSNGNFRDAFGMVLTPMHRRIMKSIVDTIQRTGFALMEYQLPPGISFSRLVNGRMYCDVTALDWANYDCTGSSPEQFRPFWGGHHSPIQPQQLDNASPEAIQARQERSEVFDRLYIEGLARTDEYSRELEAEVIRIKGILEDFSPEEDIQPLFSMVSATVRSFCDRYPLYTTVNSAAFINLVMSLWPLFGEQSIMIANGLLSGAGQEITSAEHGYRLLDLAAAAQDDPAARAFLNDSRLAAQEWERILPENSVFKGEFRDFIRDFGHRTVEELDVISPRWHEDPSYLFDFVAGVMDDPSTGLWRERQQENCRRAWGEVEKHAGSDNLEALRKIVDAAGIGAAIREASKSHLIMAVELYRILALKVGSHLAESGILLSPADVFFCTWQDLFAALEGRLEPRALQALAADRKDAYEGMKRMPAPDVIVDEKRIFCVAQPIGDENWMEGFGASAGQASGPARLLHSPAEGRRFGFGDVLVAPSTDPAWTPLFLKAAALIMETGGFLSHGAIVAREYGIPAVINVAGVMQYLEDGRKVTVDGDAGRVYVQ